MAAGNKPKYYLVEASVLPEAVKCFCAGKIRLHGGRAQILE